MCVIVTKRSKVDLPEEIIKKCYERNGHSVGFGYFKDDKPIVYKALKLEPVLEEWKKVLERNNNEVAALWHFRIKTVGDVTAKNAQPFVVNNKYIFAHNGTMTRMIQVKGDDRSDSHAFSQDILSKMQDEFYKENALIELVEMAIGFENKVCLFTGESFYYLNQHHWEEHKDLKFSNMLWNKPRYQSAYSNGYYPRTKHSNRTRHVDSHSDDKWCDYCGLYSVTMTKVGEYNYCQMCISYIEDV